MNKVQENLLKTLGLELDQKFMFELDEFKFTFKNCLHLLIRNNNAWVYNDDMLFLIINCPYAIHPLPKPILDDVEKKYLEGVLRPFKNKVKDIKLCRTNDKEVCIKILLLPPDVIWLPDFKLGTMYKGMELDKNYTLEELGLFME